ncbi:MAG: hypothetical protein AUK47_08730 [Deltaproteobacteria bacterium CG2_30_63_29]|nr:MAG: hypothetical protein AUK47_08730 [Deltaproteobacteria bacterium CG2_30_63_29]PIV99676.1 MAG: hypothetical protein COW42_10260 [Deltaproteobacteria bacterium CG17_big_fil_post_rev_8_21_14_2_50_63_7]PJB34150.1 MAG: hypothetical protein CO108_29035 [Deltaproteobacteria bacterium CG_4_9_14_3_um_filter_63_12]
MCPVDGAVLANPGPAGASANSPVKLSSATEQLLGNILSHEEDETVPLADIVGSVRQRGESESTQIGPPPAMESEDDEPHAIAPGFEDSSVNETTLSTTVAPGQPVALGKPLATLEGAGKKADSENFKSFDAAERTPPPRVFSDLQLEFSQLEGDLDDNEVTRRVGREDADRTRRSEMPPEFHELLEQEGELDTDTISMGPSDKVELDAGLNAEISEFTGFGFEEAEQKPKRMMPRYSQLQVKKVEMQLGGNKNQWQAYLLLLTAAFLLLALLVILFFW